jgi:beta-glucosidase
VEKDWPVVDYHEGIFYGYRGYDKMGKTPLFPFGHGLSYTSFDVTGMKVEAKGSDLEVSATVANTGPRDGATVLQLYLGLPGENTPRPLRQLCGFRRVEMKAGLTSNVVIPLSKEDLRYWDSEKGQWILPSGPIRLDLGISERDIRQSITLPRLGSENTMQ